MIKRCPKKHGHCKVGSRHFYDDAKKEEKDKERKNKIKMKRYLDFFFFLFHSNIWSNSIILPNSVYVQDES